MKTNIGHTTRAVHALLDKGLSLGLPGPFAVNAREYAGDLTFWTTDEVARWVDHFTLSAPKQREGSDQWATSIVWDGVEVELAGFGPTAVKA